MSSANVNETGDHYLFIGGKKRVIHKKENIGILGKITDLLKNISLTVIIYYLYGNFFIVVQLEH